MPESARIIPSLEFFITLIPEDIAIKAPLTYGAKPLVTTWFNSRLLKQFSPVFERMLVHGMKEKNEETIIIEGFELVVVLTYKYYLFCGKIVDAKDLNALLETYRFACQYMVDGMAEKAVQNMKARLPDTSQTAVEVFKDQVAFYGAKHGLNELVGLVFPN